MKNNNEIISELVIKFSRNFEEYKNPKFNEAQVRIEFVNPFWKALGWDVDNDKGYSFAYRDVIHEEEVKIGRTTKAPDYSFRIGGRRIFFVETKKPSIDLKHDPAPAFQLRRYAYSAKLPISILTDFEEFIIYDCRMKPVISDKPHVGRILYYTFEEYLEKWDEISGLLSQEAIQQGELDRYIKSKEGKKPKAEIDRDFLNDLDNWRMQLARNIALRNPQLNERELNYAVQLTIDRLIFLRMSEDRGIETQFTLQALLGGENIYRRLVQIYYKADERYNSGLFHFEEKDGPNPDTITPELALDDKILKEIIGALYYPKCPYEFSVLPVEVLGNAYEQFLGKRISLTKGHHARIEEKPEVRKAGGVYYTPKYIVDYIVKNTVGKLCENKSPKEISEIRILDPACGSGSFLLGAFQYLLDWHLEYYKNEYDKTGLIPGSPQPKSQKKRKSDTQVIFQGAGENWYLSTAEKKRILINNIYGVDIDANAVEVTKLSLLLKVLENENSETLNRQLGLWHERALPNLENNIKCGNSLIGPDFYDNQQSALFDEEEMYRVNVFEWQSEFKEIFDKGGFDAVIGNPPWIFTKYVEWGEETKAYIQNTYLCDREEDGKSKARQSGKINMFGIFLLKGLDLLKVKGIFGNIIPNNILRTTVYDTIRKKLIKNYKILKIVDLKSGVFKGVTASTIIMFIEKIKIKANHKIEIIDNNNIDKIDDKTTGYVSQIESLNNTSHVLDIFTDENFKLIESKMRKKTINLGNLVNILNGIATYKNMAEILEEKKDINSKPILFGKDIGRYKFCFSGKHVNYIRSKLLRPRDEGIFLADEKLIMQRIGGILITAYDNQKYYTFNSVNNLLKKVDCQFNLKYILGLLNSKLLRFYYMKKFVNKSSLTVNISKTFLETLPIKNIEFTDRSEYKIYNKLIIYVDTTINKNLLQYKTKEPQSKKLLQRQIEATDKQIDQLVYQLYDLTEEEIQIVEKAVN